MSPKGIKPNPEKKNNSDSNNGPLYYRQGVRSFLGAVNYCQAYLENCSAIVRPLTKLTHTHATFSWDDDSQRAFDYLKKKLVEAPILGYSDVCKPFSLYTNI